MSPNKRPPKFISIADDGEYLHALDAKGKLWRCITRKSFCISHDIETYEWVEIAIVFSKKKDKHGSQTKNSIYDKSKK